MSDVRVSDVSVSTATAQARVLGIVRGREIDAIARIELEEHALLIAWANATPWRLSLDAIDGMSLSPADGAPMAHLTLYLASGDVLDLTGDDTLRTFGARLIDHACAMPELTRGLRALGSLRGTPGSSHDAWFAPLLQSRRAVEGVSDPMRQITLMDATRLTSAMTSVIAELAAIREPADAAAQRAIEAVLEEEAEPMFTALQGMTVAADALRGGALDTRLLDWRRWVETVRGVFVAADEGWAKGAQVLRRRAHDDEGNDDIG